MILTSTALVLLLILFSSIVSAYATCPEGYTYFSGFPDCAVCCKYGGGEDICESSSGGCHPANSYSVNNWARNDFDRLSTFMNQKGYALTQVDSKDGRGWNGVFLKTNVGYKWSYGYPSDCLLYTSPSPRDGLLSRMPSSA